jgi:hypothetical protein
MYLQNDRPESIDVPKAVVVAIDTLTIELSLKIKHHSNIAEGDLINLHIS